MTATENDSARSDDLAQQAGMTEADRALLLAMRAWGPECGTPRESAPHQVEEKHDFILRFWDWFEPRWVDRLCAAWDLEAQSGHGLESARSLDRLRRMHVASVCAELGRVHPSWLVRALREESPSVQRLVAASVPGSLKNSIQAGLLLDGEDIASERPVHPIVREWVMGLWTERLLGDEPTRADDPPALVAVCGLSARAAYRLCRMAGLGKMLLAAEKPGKGRLFESQPKRAQWLNDRLSGSESEFQTAARTDVQSIIRSKLPRRLHAARIGLFTFARLLADSEPFRLRWALQHWPYPTVKLVRSIMSSTPNRAKAVLRGETGLLKTAWERLTLEGRLAEPWPGSGVENESRKA
jgi:hypothetical protein